jgi:3'(2'), 5'-bisphosphate nucleotidase
MGEYSFELEIAKRVAREAGEIILAVYAAPFEVVEKAGDQGPVTEADSRANELIVTALRREFPSDSIIAEESTRRDETPSSRRWFVDPLDGTREFVSKNGMFAVHIGLAVEGRPVAGVVFAPVSGKLYFGEASGDSWLEEAGQTRRLEVPRERDVRALHLLVSRSHPSRRTHDIMARLGITRVTEQGSVGLKVGLLAEGAADLYLHPSPRSSRWDTCAPEAVLRGAGGVLTDSRGVPYLYDAVELHNARGIIACSPNVLAAVVPVLRALDEEREPEDSH